MLSLEDFAKAPPLLHSWDGGVTWNTGGFHTDQLIALGSLVRARTERFTTFIETGAGCSTIAALLSGADKVISIAPDKELFARIESFCTERGISQRAFDKYCNFSEVALPSIAENLRSQDKWIEIALIDGGHGWPTVFVDFCYLNSVVREGGIIVLDDIQLYSVKELARFLSADANYQFLCRLGGSEKTLVFEKKTAARFLPDFGGQKYIMSRTQKDEASGSAFLLDI